MPAAEVEVVADRGDAAARCSVRRASPGLARGRTAGPGARRSPGRAPPGPDRPRSSPARTGAEDVDALDEKIAGIVRARRSQVIRVDGERWATSGIGDWPFGFPPRIHRRGGRRPRTPPACSRLRRARRGARPPRFRNRCRPPGERGCAAAGPWQPEGCALAACSSVIRAMIAAPASVPSSLLPSPCVLAGVLPVVDQAAQPGANNAHFIQLRLQGLALGELIEQMAFVGKPGEPSAVGLPVRSRCSPCCR